MKTAVFLAGCVIAATPLFAQCQPVISESPHDATGCPQQPASFDVAASGPGTLTYRWQLETQPGTWVTLGNDPFPLPCGGNASHAYASRPFDAHTTIIVHGCTGPFGVRAIVSNDCGEVTSAEAVLTALPACGGCDPDFNCDGSADQDDIGCIINVVAGNAGCECQDADFNRNGNVDQDDVVALIDVVAGGPCP